LGQFGGVDLPGSGSNDPLFLYRGHSLAYSHFCFGYCCRRHFRYLLRSYRVNKSLLSSIYKYCGKHQFIFHESGIKAQGKGYKTELSWGMVEKIDRSKGMIILFFDSANALFFPENKLPNPDIFHRQISEAFGNFGNETP
jgi:hypothetical protein